MKNSVHQISIALCTYNGAKFLNQQLESFLAQTRLPDELIVCDDCSHDETVEIIQKFSQIIPFPVRLYLNEKNLGSIKNFEKAISLCTGDLIFLADQDDVWGRQKLARIEAEFVKSAKTALVFSDAEIVDENLQPLGRNLWDFTFPAAKRRAMRKGKFFDALMSHNVVTGATMAFRADCRQIFTPIPEDIPNLLHDGWISLLIANEAEAVAIDEPLIKYRQHASQQIGIGYQKSHEKDFDERKKNYAASIAFEKREFGRLEKMKEIFAAAPQFAKRRRQVKFADLIEEKREKILHYEAQMNLPRTRPKRFLPVIKEILSGRYQRFAKGFWSPAKDLIKK